MSGWLACEDANQAPVTTGSVGAGAGATLGKVFGPQLAMKGGIGSAALTVSGVTVAALVGWSHGGSLVLSLQGHRCGRQRIG
jgi:L-aminopeptidase/D-esterase-like protein